MIDQTAIPTMLQVVDQWAAANVKALKTQILKRNIYVTGWLRASLAYNIVAAADGDVQKAQLMFAFYGRFVDMGVGKGVPLSLVKDNASINTRAEGQKNHRKRKPWYSKPMAAGVNDLREILAFHFGSVAVNTVEDGLRNTKIQIEI